MCYAFTTEVGINKTIRKQVEGHLSMMKLHEKKIEEEQLRAVQIAI